MKYICTETLEGKEEIFTFPEAVDHDCMAEVLGRIKDTTDDGWERVFREPISAGFVDENGVCHGISYSLELESRGSTDTVLLAKQINPHQ